MHDSTRLDHPGILALRLLPAIRITLMLRYKLEPSRPLVHLPKEHLADLDPVPDKRRAQQRLQLVPTAICRRPLIEFWRQSLQYPNRDVAVLEGQGFAQETTGDVDALGVRAPVRQAKLGKLRVSENSSRELSQ